MEIEDYKTATSEELSARGPQEEKLTQAVVGGLVELDSTQDGSATVLDLDLKRDLKGFGTLFESGVADPSNPNVGRYVYRRQMELGGRRIMFLERLGELDQVDAGFHHILDMANREDFSDMASTFEAYGLPREFDMTVATYILGRPARKINEAVEVSKQLLGRHYVAFNDWFYPGEYSPPAYSRWGDQRQVLRGLAQSRAAHRESDMASWDELSGIMTTTETENNRGLYHLYNDRVMMLWSWSGAGDPETPLDTVTSRLKHAISGFEIKGKSGSEDHRHMLSAMSTEAKMIRKIINTDESTEGLLDEFLGYDFDPVFFVDPSRSPITMTVTSGLIQGRIGLDEAKSIVSSHPIFDSMKRGSWYLEEEEFWSRLYEQIAIAATSSVESEELKEFIKRHQDEKHFDTRVIIGAWIARTDTPLEEIMDFYASTPKGKKGGDDLLSAAVAHRFANNSQLGVSYTADAYRKISGLEDFSLRNPTVGWYNLFTACYYERLKLLQDKGALSEHLRPGQTLELADDEPIGYRDDIRSGIVLPTLEPRDFYPLFYRLPSKKKVFYDREKGVYEYHALTSLPNPIYKPQ